MVSGLSSTNIGCEATLHAQDNWLQTFLMSSPRWMLKGDVLTLTGDAIVIEAEEPL